MPAVHFFDCIMPNANTTITTTNSRFHAVDGMPMKVGVAVVLLTAPRVTNGMIIAISKRIVSAIFFAELVRSILSLGFYEAEYVYYEYQQHYS